MEAPKEWFKDQYLISTNPSLIQPTAINAAFAREAVYWKKPVEEALMHKMLKNSLCFGLYSIPISASSTTAKPIPIQIGLVRLVTDEVSFAYLTDVYVLEEYQGKGLGTWLIGCVNEVLSSWPELRRVLVFTKRGSTLYAQNLGVKEVEQGKNGLAMFMRTGNGIVVEE